MPQALNNLHIYQRLFLNVVLAGVLFSALVGCGPLRLPEPKAEVPTQWHAPVPHNGVVADLTKWWGRFEDPVLTQLIEAGEAQSPTLEIAQARILQARAGVDKSGAGLFPAAEASGSLRRTGTGGESPDLFTTARSGGLDARWEIDVFGGRQSALAQSRARLKSAENAWHDSRVTLAAEIADAYVQYRACQAALGVAESRAASQEETRALVEIKVKAGLSEPADGDLAAAGALSAQNAAEAQKSVCAQRFNQIVELTTLPPARLSPLLSRRAPAVPLPRQAEIKTLPADMIRQRPDLTRLTAEAEAAAAAIGIARAALFPSLSLSGALGINRTETAGEVQSWSFSPAVSLPVFNAGSLRADLRRARAAYDETQAAYRAGVLAAVREVEDALVRVASVDRRLGAAAGAAERYRAHFKAARTAYETGTSSLLDLEDARRGLYGAQETLIAARLEKARAWIALYKALGGGWTETEVKQ